MKTSEFIRYAVDTQLATSHEDWAGTEKPRFLCLVFEYAHNELHDSYMYWNNYPALKKEIEIELGGCSFLQMPGIGVQDQAFYDLRFMYAEFLALYFEDLGD